LSLENDVKVILDKSSGSGAFKVSVNGLSFANSRELEISALNSATFDSFAGALSVAGANNKFNSSFLISMPRIHP
jgi:hypothetical protein